jgi:phenylacetate-CoA ligase
LYPSQAVSILELKPSLDFLRLISTVGEVVPPELTKLIAGLPDCAHYDSYGSVETGIIAGKCSQCGNYHIADRHLIVEILDEDDRPVAPGGMGRVVVTPLYNLAMPLLRFELGDFAEIALDTGCSRSRYSLTRIVGREKNLFRLPDGSRVVPMLAAYDVIALGVREYKLLQRSPLEIDFIYVPRSPEVVLTETDVQPLITRNFSPLIKASPVRVTAIPRSTSGKFLMHESLVPTA